jgi:hypothetical protein
VGSAEGSTEGDEVDILTTLIEAYEREHYPIDLPDPVEAMKFRLEQTGKNSRALIGSASGRGFERSGKSFCRARWACSGPITLPVPPAHTSGHAPALALRFFQRFRHSGLILQRGNWRAVENLVGLPTFAIRLITPIVPT